MDQTIRQAQRRGDFDDLPGAGKPLTSLDQPGDPDWWIKDLIQREKIDLSAALPGPMALRRERETYPDSLLHLPDEAAVREVLEDFNARVIADRKRPHADQGSPAIVGRVDVDQMIGRWLALRDRHDRRVRLGLGRGARILSRVGVRAPLVGAGGGAARGVHSKSVGARPRAREQRFDAQDEACPDTGYHEP